MDPLYKDIIHADVVSRSSPFNVSKPEVCSESIAHCLASLLSCQFRKISLVNATERKSE